MCTGRATSREDDLIPEELPSSRTIEVLIVPRTVFTYLLRRRREDGTWDPFVLCTSKGKD